MIEGRISAISSTDAPRIGIAIGKTNGGGLHLGILHSSDQGLHFLHLEWHHRLKNDSDLRSFGNYSWIRCNIDEVLAPQLAAFCRHIAKQNPQIPYSLRYLGGKFTREGLLQLKSGEHGLTCATFVLAVFEAVGIEVLDLSSWPQRENDISFHKLVVMLLQKKPAASPDHVENVKNEVGCARFRPEEVAGGCWGPDYPCDFTEARRRGEIILKLL